MAGISNPFPRIARPTVGSDYFGHRAYVFHPAYATAPERYVQAYVLLQTDLLHVFEYVEPADKNNGCYSFRIQEILLRACIEVEANWKAILTANHYPAGKWDRRDYRLIEESHRLSGWTVQIPHWSGGGNIRRPFAAWAPSATSSKLSWYDDYNDTKHDRHLNFEKASFETAVDAVCGVLVLLSAQFTDQEFNPTSSVWGNGTVNGWRTGIGGRFMVGYPNWADNECYSADWARGSVPPFQNFPYVRPVKAKSQNKR